MSKLKKVDFYTQPHNTFDLVRHQTRDWVWDQVYKQTLDLVRSRVFQQAIHIEGEFHE